MARFVSLFARLRAQLDALEWELLDFLKASPIVHRREDPYSSVVLIRPSWGWGKPDEAHKRRQFRLLKDYDEWLAHFQLVLQDAPPSAQREAQDADRLIRSWIEQHGIWDVPRDFEEARKRLSEEIVTYAGLLDAMSDPSTQDTLLVPDTNALIREPDLTHYRAVAGVDRFTVVLIPTVLSELDRLRVVHRDEAFRKKVEGVIRRIKGWRAQGSLHDGVKVEGPVSVRMVASEPDFSRTLRWLDSSNQDDRIIASALELQRGQPTAVVVVVTGDINLQNKAEMARLPYTEPPEPNMVATDGSR